MKKLFIIFVIFLTGLASLPGQTMLTYAVDFTVADMQGGEHTLYDYLDQGNYVMVMFFYTECNPCIGSVPGINQAFDKYGCNEGNIRFLSIDFNDTQAELQQFIDQFGLKIPSVSGLDGAGNQVIYDYGILSFPTVILIHPDRTIIAQDIYPVTLENLDIAINDLAGIDPYQEGCYLTGTTNVEADQAWLETDVRLSPNPAVGGVVFLQLDLPRTTELMIRIFDGYGRLCWSQPARLLSSGRHQLYLDLPSLPGGTYLVCLENSEGKMIHRKLLLH